MWRTGGRVRYICHLLFFGRRKNNGITPSEFGAMTMDYAPWQHPTTLKSIKAWTRSTMKSLWLLKFNKETDEREDSVRRIHH